MPLLARLRSLGRTLFRGRQLDADLDAELESSLDELTDRHVARGLDRDAARRAARLELGGVEQLKEQVRDARIGNGVETTAGDLRYAWRGLRRAPGFAAVTVLTLGLGIGATTAIFSIVHALLLEPLPFRDAGRLVFVWQDLTASGYPRAPLAGPELKDLRERATRFESFGGIWSNTAVLTDEEPEQLRIGLVTSDFFSTLGASPLLGRVFGPEDDAPTASRSILLSWPLWQRRFAGDPAVVGRRIQANGGPVTVIGVMPQGFRLMLPADASVPDDLQAWLLLDSRYTRWARGQQFLRVVARMKPGVQLSDAQQEIAALGKAIAGEHAHYGRAGLTLYAVALHEDSTREVRPALLALFAGVAILLLIACVNVAGLLVARAAGRTRETAVRLALGAGTGRLLRQYAIEGLVLGLLGGAAGVVIGRALLSVLVALRPATLSRIDIAALDPTVLGLTAGVALAWGFLLSLAPFAEVRRTDITGALQHGERQAGTALHYRRRAALVVVQLALSLVLLVSAGLLVRAFQAVLHVDPGFRADGLLTFRLSIAGPRFTSRAAVTAFSQEFRSALAALPGVTGVGAISHLPYDELPNWGTPYRPEGEPDPALSGHADTRAVTPGYLEAVGATLLDGRLFSEADDATTTPVAIVDERLAARLWPGQRAIGKRFIGDPATSGTASTLIEVVGVVRHLRHRQPTASVREQIYFPVRQAPRNPMAYVVRSGADPTLLAAEIRQTLARLDGRLPIYDVRPMSSYVESARAARRFTALLAVAFAAVALALTCIGVYGVTAYAVALRRREFGVRLALGASRAQVLRVVFAESGRLAVWGFGLGLAGAATAAMLLRSQLFGITPSDPLTFALAIPALAAAVAVATWLPSRRALLVNPVEALRA